MQFASLRTFALSLPEVTEEPHHNDGSFPPERQHVHVFVSEQHREQALAVYPGFTEKLLWGGKVVGLRVRLATAEAPAVKQLLRQAWHHKAPKALRSIGSAR